MENIDLGFLVIGIFLLGLAPVLSFLARRFRRDEIFTSVPPGLTPLPGADAAHAKVQGQLQEYSGEVAVAFNPPRGLRPGLVGTLIDSTADMRDITATVVDLGVRGHLTIKAEAPSGKKRGGAQKPQDFVITKAEVAPNDQLEPFEVALMQSLFSFGPEIRMSQWAKGRGPAMVRDDLYRQVVSNGWYRRDPRKKHQGLAILMDVIGIAFAGLVVLARPSFWGILAAALIAVGTVWTARSLKGRVPRTAPGTAAYIQALGFKKYLATAEADQFSFEEAAGVFSKYLPYAIVFGVADHWAKTFGQVVEHAEQQGVATDLLFDLMWFDLTGMDDLAFYALWGMGDGDLGGLFDLGADGLGEIAGGIGDLADGLSGFAEAVGDFISDIDFDL